jgi:DNA-binding transcriptional ArsR family regulator
MSVAEAKAKPAKSWKDGPTDARAREVAEMFKQLGDATRLRVMMRLAGGERNVGELCADLGGLSQPALSHHLALLRATRLIEPRRRGKHVNYSLTDRGLSLVRAAKVID